MALPGSHVFFLPVPQQTTGPLAEMDQCRLPSLVEQADKTAKALHHLHAYVESCGGKLPDGWDCKLRFRTTTRRNGRLGLTTDNYYYSPCGKTFRSHKLVADFLKLSEPQQPKQQRSSSTSTPAVGAKRPLQVTACTLVQRASKRVALPASSCDSAATEATAPAGTASPPAAAVPAASCSSPQQLQLAGTEQCVQSMPPPPPQPVRRTKAMLADKYAAAAAAPLGTVSCIAVSASTTSSAAAAAPLGTVRCIAVGASTTSSAATASGVQQQQRWGVPAPCMSGTTSCSTASAFAATDSACSSQLPAASTEQQQQQRSCKPWKPKALPSWRANLRELASKIAASKMASRSTSNSAADASVTAGAAI